MRLDGYHKALMGFDFADASALLMARRKFADYLAESGVDKDQAVSDAQGLSHSWEFAVQNLGKPFMLRHMLPWRGFMDLRPGSPHLRIFGKYAELREGRSYDCQWCGLHRYHLPGEHDQCAHSPTGECSPVTSNEIEEGRRALSTKAQAIIEERGMAAEFSKLRAKISSGQQTREIYMKGGEYILGRKQLHDKIVDGLVANVPKSANPTFILMGGLPGSGKSAIVKREGFADYVKIDSDMIKAHLPEYRGWNAALLQKEADDVIGRAISRAVREKKNILLDTTLKNHDKYDRILKIMDEFRYRKGVIFSNVTPENAMHRVIDRYKSNGRFVDPLYVASHDALNSDTYRRLKAKADFYSLYDNNGPKGEPPKLKESNRAEV